ncbi:MAG: cytochrome b/b6 domain-containing protein [Planctomycetota bacterium]
MGVFKTLAFTLPPLQVLVFCVLYLIFQPRRAKPAQETQPFVRFSLLERLVHALTILSLLVLMGTGCTASVGLGPPLHGWYLIAHCVAGSLFTLALLASMVLWAEASCFEPCDWQWMRGLGGYLWGRAPLPAGRLDCGQKLMFWSLALLSLAALVTATLPFLKWFGTDTQQVLLRCHRYSALFLGLAVIKHIYIVFVAKPGGWRLIISGVVSAEWAKSYHSLWRPESKNGNPSATEPRA